VWHLLRTGNSGLSITMQLSVCPPTCLSIGLSALGRTLKETFSSPRVHDVSCPSAVQNKRLLPVTRLFHTHHNTSLKRPLSPRHTVSLVPIVSQCTFRKGKHFALISFGAAYAYASSRVKSKHATRHALDKLVLTPYCTTGAFGASTSTRPYTTPHHPWLVRVSGTGG
jgi:hypothetical protein